MNVFIRYLFVVVCCSVVWVQAAAQHGSVSGTVSYDAEPMEGVHIRVLGLDRIAMTDSAGGFLIRDIPSGEYELEISYVGLSAQRVLVEVLDTQMAVLDIALSVDSDLLDEVVVTGTMKPTYVSASPIKVDVVTLRQVETFLPTAASSIVESIQLVNGVQEVVACGVCYTNSISINGLPGPYTAILVDGTPMYGNLASVYGLNGIPAMIVDRFEVIKGPSSTLYGTEAVAGVINIITKDPSTQPRVDLDVMLTSHGERFGTIAMAPKIGESHGYVGLNYGYANSFEDHNSDGFGDLINFDRYSLFTKWNIHRPSGKTFSIAAKYYYEDRRNGVQEFLEDRSYRQLRGDRAIYGESIYTHRAELFGSYVFDMKANIRLDYSFSHHDQDSYYGSDHYIADQQIAFGNLIYNTEMGRHDLTTGITLRYNAYDDNTVATETWVEDGVQNHPDEQLIPGIFCQDEMTVSDKLIMLGGARLDHYGDHGFIFAPRINLKYNPRPSTSIRANFGTGFRVVNLFTEDHAFVTGQREVVLAEELEPEESYNFSLNVNEVYSGLGGAGNIDLEAYYTHFTNQILPNYDTPGQIVYSNSSGHAETMGFGVNWVHSFELPVSFSAGVRVQQATETEIYDDGRKSVRDIEFAPVWSGVLTLNYESPRTRTQIGYTTTVTGTMQLPEVFDLDGSTGLPLADPRATRSQPFSIHNVQLTHPISDEWTIYGGVQNIFGFRQAGTPLIGYDDPNSPVGFSDYFDASYAYAPIHGREWYLGLKWRWNREGG